MKYVIDEKLFVKLICQQYLGSELREQIVTLVINGEKIGKWDIDKSGEYTMNIQKNIMNKENANFSFGISNPISPAEEGISKDNRRLGIAVKAFVITDNLS